MKKLILVCFPTLLLSATIAVLPARAEVTQLKTDTTQVAEQVSPFNLSMLAYQGYLENEGIPSAGMLIQKYQARELDAKQIVEAAIRAHRLSPDSLSDPGYLNALDNNLMSFSFPRR